MLQPPFRYEKAKAEHVDGWTGVTIVCTAYPTPRYTPKAQHDHGLVVVIDLTEIEI